tara:strand:- start:653 stop:1234 length:582 start_codon:yes stop_codon:yes gene_type:complete
MKNKLIVLPLLMLLILASVNTFAQKKKKKKDEIELVPPTFEMKEGKVVYSEVVDQAGVSPEELHKRCFTWFNAFYKNPGGVIKENIANQKIKGKARLPLFLIDGNTETNTRAGLMSYSIEIGLKDGKYRYNITRINKKAQSFLGIEKLIAVNEKEYKMAYVSYMIQTDKYMKDLIDNLKKSMASSTEKKSDDW